MKLGLDGRITHVEHSLLRHSIKFGIQQHQNDRFQRFFFWGGGGGGLIFGIQMLQTLRPPATETSNKKHNLLSTLRSYPPTSPGSSALSIRARGVGILSTFSGWRDVFAAD